MGRGLNKTLFVVAVVGEYSVDSVFVYTDRESAYRKVLSVGRELFGKVSFSNSEEVLEYQDSEEWWDNDFRRRVVLTRVLVDANK